MGDLPEHTAQAVGEALYLDRQAVKTGDVLLTRGPGKSSRLIAVSTLGPFSHAAIVVNSGALFESDDVGVGYTALTPARVEGTGEHLRVLYHLTGVELAVLLRHPALAALRRSDELAAEEELMELLYPSLGLEYPEWIKLAPAVARGGPIARVILGALDAYESDKVWHPGPFCSQLVAAALSELLAGRAAGLFSATRAANTVSPNAFLESELRPVPHAVGPRGPAPVNAEVLQMFLRHVPSQTRADSTGVAVTTKVRATVNVETAGRIVQEQSRILREGLARLRWRPDA